MLVRPPAECWLTDMDGVLVREEVENYPFRPGRILPSIGNAIELV